MPVLLHILYTQIFQADQVKVLDQAAGQLLLGVFSLVPHVLMQPGDEASRLVPAAAALCFSGQLPLKPGQAAQAASEVFWIFIPDSFRTDGEVREAHIEADRPAGLFQRGWLDIRTADGYKIFPRRRQFYGCVQNPALYRTRYPAFHKAELWKLDPVVEDFDS